jgi:uncharacterized Zn finger protein (UPF0148 family)
MRFSRKRMNSLVWAWYSSFRQPMAKADGRAATIRRLLMELAGVALERTAAQASVRLVEHECVNLRGGADPGPQQRTCTDCGRAMVWAKPGYLMCPYCCWRRMETAERIVASLREENNDLQESEAELTERFKDVSDALRQRVVQVDRMRLFVGDQVCDCHDERGNRKLVPCERCQLWYWADTWEQVDAATAAADAQ